MFSFRRNFNGWAASVVGLAILANPLTVFAQESGKAVTPPVEKPKLAELASEPKPAPAETVTVPAEKETHPLLPAIQMAKASRDALAKVKDYSATFSKREQVGRTLTSQKMQLKVREQPFSVYLLFDQPSKGREVIYVEGQNKNMLLAHETGLSSLVGTVPLAPNSPTAMADNKYPVTMIGMKNMVETVIKQWEAETKFAETEVQYFPNAKLGTTECKVIESKHPVPRSHFNFHLTRLYIEKQNELPIRVEQYGFPKKGEKQVPVLEEYTYTNIKVNPGLTSQDFDTRNPNYAFAK